MSLLYPKEVAKEVDRIAMQTIRFILCTQAETGLKDDTAIRSRIAGVIDMADAVKETFSENKE